jgi:hypothetical protein
MSKSLLKRLNAYINRWRKPIPIKPVIVQGSFNALFSSELHKSFKDAIGKEIKEIEEFNSYE